MLWPQICKNYIYKLEYILSENFLNIEVLRLMQVISTLNRKSGDPKQLSFINVKLSATFLNSFSEKKCYERNCQNQIINLFTDDLKNERKIRFNKRSV